MRSVWTCFIHHDYLSGETTSLHGRSLMQHPQTKTLTNGKDVKANG